MPYELIEMDGRFCVRKQGEHEPIDGGCHDTEQQAQDHMAALYAAEQKAISLNEIVGMVQEALARDAGPMDDFCYAEFVYDTYAIVNKGGLYYRVEYTRDASGVRVQPAADWRQVEREWKRDVPRGRAPSDAALGDPSDLMAAIMRVMVARKAGQRHSAADQKLLDAMHTMAVDLGAACGAVSAKTQRQRTADGAAEPSSHKSIALGGQLKAVSPGKVRGLGVVYGGQDLVGDTFTKDTDLGASRSFLGMPVYYDHGLSGVKSQVGHVTAYEFTDDGIDFEIELDKRKSYLDAIMRLVNEKALGLSTGALSHMVYRDHGDLKRWIIGEISLTPTPAEPRTGVQYVKILLDAQQQEVDDLYVIV